MAINLSKSGDHHKIDLTKKSIAQIQVHANLNWRQESSGGGFLKSLFKSAPPDLDLGCMYELVSGERGVIQPLGGNFGSKDNNPYIYLDKDDRSGASTDGENMYIIMPELVKRVMFFALIYEGAKNFQAVGGYMTFNISNGESISLQLNNPNDRSVFCSAALLTNVNNNLTITKEERYFAGHKFADDYYGFGFNWVAGSK